MKSITITLPHSFVRQLLAAGQPVQSRLQVLDAVINDYILPKMLEPMSDNDHIVLVCRLTAQRAASVNNAFDVYRDKIAQIKAMRELVRELTFPQDTRDALRRRGYLSYGCDGPGLAEAKKFVEENSADIVAQHLTIQ